MLDATAVGLSREQMRPLGWLIIFPLLGALGLLALAAQRRKVVTGDVGMIDLVGVTQTDLSPTGKIFVHGEIWEARAPGTVAAGTRVRVKEVQGLTLVVEREDDSR